MAPLDLDGDTLGKKHQHYNKLLKEAIDNGQTVSDFKLEDNDIENLLKIDLASHNKDVDYILSVFKCGDMLCVSRAITQCTWLITEQQYANIINPEYLHTQLLPHMNTKAFIKLNKHIRHNIKDEARAENFYLHEKQLTESIKWLPHCSVSFIENNVAKHVDHIKVRTFKRLCEKSITIFEIVLNQIQVYDKKRYAQAVTFFLHTDVDKYLDIIEKNEWYHGYPNFSDKATDLIMKKSPKRVIDKFDQYIKSIDIPTFSKYLKPDEIKTFLYTQAKKDNNNHKFYGLQRLFNYDILKYFIRRLPKGEQYDFVKKIFIDKENADIVEENLTPGTEAYDMKKLFNAVPEPSYVWYRFATFQNAFEEITRLISKDLDNDDKYAMLNILISCAEHNLQHIQTLLNYYLDKHKNEEYYYKLQFVTELLKRTNIHQYDEKAWNMLNELFKALKMYEDSGESSYNNDNECIDAIIIYNLLHDQKIPAVIEKSLKFTFRTLKSYRDKLNHEQKEKIFCFLYENQLSKLNDLVVNEEEFAKSIKILENVFELLRDWKKQLIDYPLVIDKIKEFVKIKRENSWKESLSSLYNFNKSWRRHMFEESVVMNASEKVCLNALKHEPQLLERYKKEVETLQTNDAISLQRLLAKLRVHWPHSLAQHWTLAYLENLNRIDGHKATIRGLCTSLPQKPLLEIIEKYKPAQAKIDWNGVDDRILSIQRFLAKNMHLARPQLSPDNILLYAKGDYLQFALPSLLAIFYNLNISESHQYIPKLLDAPVSIQKHGIRFAFQKLDHASVKNIFLKCWKASKNVSIRAIIFKFTFELLCNEKDPTKAVGLWELIELFIDNLTFEEDKTIYELLANVEKIPLNVRANYLIKSYKFIESLIPKVKEADRANYEVLSAQLAQHSREIMELLNEDFVIAIIQQLIDKDFFGYEGKFETTIYYSNGIIPVLSAFLLCAKNENIQTQKYEKVLVPLMKRAFAMWGEKRDGNYFIRLHFQHLLTCLSLDLKEYVVEKSMIIPVTMFLNIQNELNKSLSISENYLMLTKWKITVAIAQLTDKANVDCKDWENMCTKIAPEFGKLCLEYLKQDVKLHFSCIYKLFSKALDRIFKTIIPEGAKLEIYECMLSDNDFVQGYLTIIDISFESYTYDKNKYEKLWQKILSHPSVEVKMHYYYRNGEERRYVQLLR